MATTYKLHSSATSDGAVYIDLPISGRVTNVHFDAYLLAGAGGVGVITLELSRVAVNQIATSNPRGVLANCYAVTQAASTGAQKSADFAIDEPVKSGERLYLNCAGSATNMAGLLADCFITIA